MRTQPRMNYLSKLTALLCMVVFCACTEDQIDPNDELDFNLERAISTYSPTNSSDFYILPERTDLKQIPQDSKNKLTPQKVKLGNFLFFETGLATDAKLPEGMGTYSCATCHVPEAGFRPGFLQGIADGGMGFGYHGDGRIKNNEYNEEDLDVQAARPLSLINVAFVKNTSWNGAFGAGGVNVGTEELWGNSSGTVRNNLGYEGLETQNIQGLTTHRMIINRELVEEFGYKQLYDESFPEINEVWRYSNFTTAMAISAYLRTVVADKAPFQDWLNGDKNAMSIEEKEGAMIFFGKAQCNSCHYDKNLGSSEFHALGVNDMDQHPGSFFKRPDDKRNLGRGGFTQEIEDLYKFKVPGIYNSSDTPFYFHGSSKETLEEVIRYKIAAVGENERVPAEQVSKKLRRIPLSDEEVDKLALFLSKSLRDPDIARYKPNHIYSGNCFPNNDHISKGDLDCN
ncbi:hypothetical protein N9L92_01465 [Saprospiraceae bacterium]|nr:hypothetical protein [Saprospiraceae bacterium]